MVWCGVVWCGVVLCGVVLCGVTSQSRSPYSHTHNINNTNTTTHSTNTNKNIPYTGSAADGDGVSVRAALPLVQVRKLLDHFALFPLFLCCDCPRCVTYCSALGKIIVITDSISVFLLPFLSSSLVQGQGGLPAGASPYCSVFRCNNDSRGFYFLSSSLLLLFLSCARRDRGGFLLVLGSANVDEALRWERGGYCSTSLLLLLLLTRLRFLFSFLLCPLLLSHSRCSNSLLSHSRCSNSLPSHSRCSNSLPSKSLSLHSLLYHRGYMTKYDCSSADINPIGALACACNSAVVQ